MNGLKILGFLVVLVLAGCAPRYGTGGETWPYPNVLEGGEKPPELRARAIYAGRWIAADPITGTVLTETSDPRFLARFSFQAPRRVRYLDLGWGAEVENLAFIDSGRSALLVGAVSSPHHGQAIVARSLLKVDLEQGNLIDTIPLERDGFARGMAVDRNQSRVFLLSEDGMGNGRLERINLYDGSVLERPTGVVPSGVFRKGLVLDRNSARVFCLAGGDPARNDFAPVPDEEPGAPELLILETDSLKVRTRIPLDRRFTPVAAAYDEFRDRAYALVANRRQSRLVIVDSFEEVRSRIDIPDVVTDLVLANGYAYMPSAHGLYLVDLDLETWATRSGGYPLELTGEIVVSEDGSLAMVSFQSSGMRAPSGPPGIAVIHLQTGNMMDLLQ